MLIAFVLAITSASVHAEKLVIAVASVPHSLPFYVAEHEGYFAEESSDIVIADCFPGRKCLDQLLDGKVLFATVADTPIVVSSFVRMDFLVLATFATSTNDIRIVGLKSAGVTSARSLAGKRVGILKGSSVEYFLDTTLLFNGIDPASVQKIQTPASDTSKALLSRQIDAAALFDPYLNQTVSAAGSDAVVLDNANIYLSTFNLVVARSAVGTKEAAMKKILRALDKAIRFIRTDPDKAQVILQQRLKTPAQGKPVVKIQIDYGLSLDQAFIKTLEAQARWLTTRQDIAGHKPANYLDLVYPLPLSEVRARAVTLVK